jgi:hypothetical protein
LRLGLHHERRNVEPTAGPDQLLWLSQAGSDSGSAQAVEGQAVTVTAPGKSIIRRGTVVKITNAGRDLRPNDLNGGNMVFCVAYATIRAPDDTVLCEGWYWHAGTEFV